ncbi:cytochrome-c peroxidase [Thiohalobacter sp. IOR34]|uniref:cytochrome-c peroxidase n=1 Tax=Thiohalobacter sp. IOR34 TaxID=3057176 RepID=UPI0025B1B990|nr:cytochrome-c peroxidase [Thiohalobacter sp. IOR34]WJW76035.1 cytochrome-c peroxidase [Thiohalobacter sp. IOR34]
MKVLTAITLSLGVALGSSVAQAANWEALPETAPAPADNPTTAEKVALGQKLYFDPRLSSTGTVSCNSCHNVMLGGDDNRPVSMGVHGRTGGRSAPTVWNSAFNGSQFWDGRAPSLEEQAKGPVLADVEMDMGKHDHVVARIKSIPGYQAEFEKAFGPGEIDIDKFAKAVAAYERTLITPNSPYDRYVKGDRKALTRQQVRGMDLFAGIGCAGCHSGPAFNGATPNSGTGSFMKFPTFADSAYVKKYDLLADEGRAKVTGKAADKHLFKVPTLRNVALTAPYFHNGSVKTLDEAVRVMAKVQLNRELSDAEVADLVAFLNALTGEFPKQEMPRLPATAGFSVID